MLPSYLRAVATFKFRDIDLPLCPQRNPLASLTSRREADFLIIATAAIVIAPFLINVYRPCNRKLIEGRRGEPFARASFNKLELLYSPTSCECPLRRNDARKRRRVQSCIAKILARRFRAKFAFEENWPSRAVRFLFSSNPIAVGGS